MNAKLWKRAAKHYRKMLRAKYVAVVNRDTVTMLDSMRPQSQSEAAQSSKRRESLEERVARLERETSQRGWDDDDADPIPRLVWGRVRELLGSVPRAFVPEPSVSPCADGTVHVRWLDDSGRAFVAEISDNEYCYSFRPAPHVAREYRDTIDQLSVELEATREMLGEQIETQKRIEAAQAEKREAWLRERDELRAKQAVSGWGKVDYECLIQNEHALYKDAWEKYTASQAENAQLRAGECLGTVGDSYAVCGEVYAGTPQYCSEACELRAALEAVEWVWDGEHCVYFCASCASETMGNTGQHKPDCIVGKALQNVGTSEQVPTREDGGE